jgi:hypothetical protein
MTMNSILSELGCILRLNKAGRRYILRDPSSISDSIDMFSQRRCQFRARLCYNPRLCHGTHVETENGESNGSSTARSDMVKARNCHR